MSVMTGLAIALTAALVCLALGALAAAAYDRAVANAHPLDERARRAALATDQFEAMTHCPECGAYGPHLMREPRRASTADVKAWEARYAEFLECRDEVERIELRSFGGGLERTAYCGPTFRERRPIDESEYSTIRICECGKEWGQK
ncbi:hypothetical protein GS917_25155 [Rhodococcus hoagii]|uniref:hypothetical protein n=1 Tax=Rhodococcus hoagii TaxID=43767 RepID=UPI000A0FB5BB|nr:hypothetical protein [Prescottella equi]NKT99807.1 hypothetical protein [Prescottella equi]NKU01750.1 hypothetical protein [Prescottella equi]NKV36710.1 hypothetical protein [Prescottella equi]NKV37938.1 hypothetical protein [Prescottella equi]ORL33102.1 hypothetical protein A6I87_22675 [Prescottella equi]